MLFLLIALTCPPGERMLDLTGKLPPNIRSLDFSVTDEPFYARIYIYEAGIPDTFH